MATQDPTTNYAWDLPTVGGSTGAWGTALNTIIGDDATGIDAIVKAVSDVADAAMPKSGGTFTGEIKVLTEIFTHSSLGNIGTTQELDLDVAMSFDATVTDDVTISFGNVPATGSAVFVNLELVDGGAHTITWPTSVDWPSGTAPALQASGRDILTFYTRDGGTTWHGMLSSSNSS